MPKLFALNKNRVIQLSFFLFFAWPLLGAKGKGCAAEYTNNGSSSSWDTGEIPDQVGEVQPMTCEWLKSDNCWTKVVNKVKACAGEMTESGVFSEERTQCDYESGAKWQLGGAIGTPASTTTQFEAVDWRLITSDGDTCATGKIVGVGKHILDVDGEVVYFESQSLTTYHLVCPDGKTYGNDVEGTCDSFGLEWLTHDTPGVLMTCHGDTKECDLGLWAGENGEATVARCGW